MSLYRKALPWIVWSLASVFYAFQYILRVFPSVTMDEIMVRFQIDATIFGQFSGLYYLGYAGMHIPLGIMLDRVGPRKVLPLSILFILIGLTPLLFSHSWFLACVGRLFIGMGSSAAILGVFKVVRMTFSEEKFGRMLGLSVTIGLIGALYGSRPLSYLLDVFGWEKVLYIIMLTGLLLCAFIYIVVPAHKEDRALSHSIIDDIKRIVATPNVLLICVFAGFMVAPLDGFADAWGVPFLVTVYGFDKVIAATLPSFVFIGMAVGSPLLPLMAEKSKRYYELIIASALVMSASFVVFLVGYASYYALCFLFFITGIACAYQILAIYKASTYVPESLTSLTTASVNMIIMAFGYMFHSAIGCVMDVTWDGKMVSGIPVYGGLSYQLALAVIPVALILGAVGFFWVRSRSRRAEQV